MSNGAYGGVLSGSPARAGELTLGPVREGCAWGRDRRGRATTDHP